MTRFAWACRKLPGLFADGFDYFGVAMTGVGHADTAGEVEQFASIIGVDVRTFCTFSDKIEDAAPDRGHVRKVIGVESVCICCHGFP